jgi:type III secretion protein W
MRVDLQNTGVPQTTPDTPQQVVSQTGVYRGEQIRVQDTASSILDSAKEEITATGSEKAEARKSLSERRIGTDRQLPVQSLEEIKAYLEGMKRGDEQGKLEEFAKAVLQRKGGNPREQARQAFEDPTDQFVALQYALARAQESGADPDLVADLQDAIEELDEDHGPQIWSGLNSTQAAASYATTAAQASEFRNTYRDVVLGAEGLAKTLDLLVEKHGAQALPAIVPSLIKALGDDLAALRPSREPEHLQAVLQDLYHLEVAVTVLDSARELGATLQNRHGTPAFDPVVLMKETIALTGERWVNGSRFTSLAEKLGVNELPAQINFLTGVKNMIREMPVKVFPDADARQALINAVQDALDAAVEREENG